MTKISNPSFVFPGSGMKSKDTNCSHQNPLEETVKEAWCLVCYSSV